MSRVVTGARQPPHSFRRAEAQLPFGGGAVMAHHAGQVVEGDDPVTALHRQLNFFPTPPWAARAGGELVRSIDPGARTVWEPACGAGHMAGPLMELFEGAVWPTDVHLYEGPCPAIFLGDFPAGDFDGRAGEIRADWVITNPPFSKGEAFVRQGLKVARRGVAVLCRLAFVESEGRYDLMTRMALKAPFTERVPMQLGSWDPDLSSATAYAWFVWLQPAALAESPLRPAIEAARAAGCTLERLIEPGTKARLTRPTDREIYAGEAPSPQLDLLGVG